MNVDHGRLVFAYLCSLLLHALLLSLTFGDQGAGLPGLSLPWGERRIEAPELRAVLVPVPAADTEPTAVAPAEPSAASAQGPTQVSLRRMAAGEPSPKVATSHAPIVPRKAVVAPAKARPAAPDAVTTGTARTAEASDVADVVKADETGETGRTAEVAAEAPLPIERTEEMAPTSGPRPAVIAMARPDDPAWIVPPPPTEAAAGTAEAAKLISPDIAMPAPRDVRAEIVRKSDEQEAKEQQAAEIARQEAAKAEAARMEAQRVEAERREAAKAEAARMEAQRVEAERREAAKAEAARMEAQRVEAERREAAKAEAARMEAQRVEAERREAAKAEAARAQAEQEEDARREARRRAMGRELEEAAARRQAAAAARAANPLPLSLSTARRVRLWGRADPNADLVDYAEAWARKIQFNTPVETVREVARQAHTNAMVTAAIRSDGTVESVTIVLSSGVAEIDETIRRIIESHAPYPAFPPRLARQYDVVEVRRTWQFDTAIRLY